MNGGAGDDSVGGGSGNATIFGGPGHDTIRGGGRDVIFARDGVRDWIDCGTEYDVVVADRFDHVHRDCERVLRGWPGTPDTLRVWP